MFLLFVADELIGRRVGALEEAVVAIFSMEAGVQHSGGVPHLDDLLLSLLGSRLARDLPHLLGSISIAFRIGDDRKFLKSEY